MAAAVPAALGRYQVVRELGRGAMGVVYLGKDPTIQRHVAIKTMRLDDIDNEEELKAFRDRFFREAESTGRLSHPNIVTVYDAGEQEGLAYIAMEYLEGTLLSCYCQKSTLLPAKQALQIVATVADALDYAHSQGVIHRDVKPPNIMILKQRLVKVMDFGIAKMASGSKTQTSMILGTPRYMSPEQATGKDVDGRSDVFSLGIVLFELLTGDRPFDAENMPALVMRIAKGPACPAAQIPPRSADTGSRLFWIARSRKRFRTATVTPATWRRTSVTSSRSCRDRPDHALLARHTGSDLGCRSDPPPQRRSLSCRSRRRSLHRLRRHGRPPRRGNCQ